MSIVGEASKRGGSCRSEYVVQGESVMQLERLSICQSRRQKMLWLAVGKNSRAVLL